MVVFKNPRDVSQIMALAGVTSFLWLDIRFLFLTGKDEGSQSQDIRRVLFHIDHHVAVRSGVARAKASRKNCVLLGYIWCASAMICDTSLGFLKRYETKHAGYPEIENLHLSRWGIESVCRVIKRMLHPGACHSCIRYWGNNMVSQRLKKHANELVYLKKARPCIRNHLITKAEDPKNPPFCEIAFSFLRESDFFDNALNPALFLLSFSFWSLVNGTLPLKILSAHSQTVD
jgi:hypothetical protein